MVDVLDKIEKKLDVLRSEKASLEKGIEDAKNEIDKSTPVLAKLRMQHVGLKKTLKAVGEDPLSAPDFKLIVSRENVLADRVAKGESYLAKAEPHLSEIGPEIVRLSDQAGFYGYISLEAERFKLLKKGLDKGLSKNDEKKLQELNGGLRKYNSYNPLTGKKNRYMQLIKENRFSILDLEI